MQLNHTDALSGTSIRYEVKCGDDKDGWFVVAPSRDSFGRISDPIDCVLTNVLCLSQRRCDKHGEFVVKLHAVHRSYARLPAPQRLRRAATRVRAVKEGARR